MAITTNSSTTSSASGKSSTPNTEPVSSPGATSGSQSSDPTGLANLNDISYPAEEEEDDEEEEEGEQLQIWDETTLGTHPEVAAFFQIELDRALNEVKWGHEGYQMMTGDASMAIASVVLLDDDEGGGGGGEGRDGVVFVKMSIAGYEVRPTFVSAILRVLTIRKLRS